MCRDLRGRASFAFVYVAKAHAVDEWQLQSNLDEGILLPQHRTLEDRIAGARQGVERLRLTLPVLVDGMDDAVSEAFAAWPERIYVVSADARVAFRGGPGPWEFDPEAARAALERMLGESDERAEPGA
jgi:Iodothyronine deiodinase